MKNTWGVRVFSLLLCFCFLLCSCSGTVNTDSDSSNNSSNYTPNTTSNQKGSWDNTPNVLMPSADNTQAYSSTLAVIDASHCDQGYIMAAYLGANPKVKLQITGSNNITYTYNLSTEYETFPLTSGSGKYNVGIYENIEGTQYVTVLSQDISVNITNEFGPYLYPNQYVNFVL